MQICYICEICGPTRPPVLSAADLWLADMTADSTPRPRRGQRGRPRRDDGELDEDVAEHPGAELAARSLLTPLSSIRLMKTL